MNNSNVTPPPPAPRFLVGVAAPQLHGVEPRIVLRDNSTGRDYPFLRRATALIASRQLASETVETGDLYYSPSAINAYAVSSDSWDEVAA